MTALGTLGVIAARGGSKRLPGKNVRPLGGRPLVAWSVAAAASARSLDRTVLSTDDPAIIEAAVASGGDAPFVRPAALATDDASPIDALLHAWEATGGRHAWIVLLQATSPFRLAADIDGCVAAARDAGAPAAVTVTAPEKPAAWLYRLGDDRRLSPLLATDPGPVGRLNGAVYVAHVDFLRRHRTFVTSETVGYVMPWERSVDIDTSTDFLIAEALLADGRVAAPWNADREASGGSAAAR